MRAPSAYDASVCSGRYPDAPRWAITSGLASWSVVVVVVTEGGGRQRGEHGERAGQQRQQAGKRGHASTYIAVRCASAPGRPLVALGRRRAAQRVGLLDLDDRVDRHVGPAGGGGDGVG